MDELEVADPGTLGRLRRYLSARELSLNMRLPPERELSRLLGVSRTDLRKALSVLESEGQIWRHVGRGTFIGARPVHNLHDVAYLGELAKPAQVMEARLAVEPQLARLAALHGAKSDFLQIEAFSRRCRQAQEWRVYEAWDNNFHQAIAAATHNKLLINLFDTLNAVRRATVWGQLRSTRLPPADHGSFEEHDAIHAAIARRDAEGAAACMRLHLRSVRDRLLPPRDA
jgi:DNA-binding FadR family transcriptional regulator